MSGCGCSFTPVENKETEEIKYTDALAEQLVQRKKTMAEGVVEKEKKLLALSLIHI